MTYRGFCLCARIKSGAMAQNSGMKKRVGVYDPEGVRTREEREILVRNFTGKEERNGGRQNVAGE